MIIYSEILDKTFDSVDECLDAELEFRRAEKAREEAEARRQAELDEAYEDAIAACERYLELAGVDVKIENVIEEDDEELDDCDFIDLLLDILDEL